MHFYVLMYEALALKYPIGIFNGIYYGTKYLF